MNSKTELNQQYLLCNLIRLAYTRLINHYNNAIFTDSACGEEKVKEILDILDLAVNEIDRLMDEE